MGIRGHSKGSWFQLPSLQRQSFARWNNSPLLWSRGSASYHCPGLLGFHQNPQGTFERKCSQWWPLKFYFAVQPGDTITLKYGMNLVSHTQRERSMTLACCTLVGFKSIKREKNHLKPLENPIYLCEQDACEVWGRSAEVDRLACVRSALSSGYSTVREKSARLLNLQTPKVR